MKTITVQELKAMIDNKDSFQLIDVREQEEYNYCNLNGELIPLAEIIEKRDKIATDKKVVFYCRSGARSAQAVTTLETHFDFDNLYNLTGGILAWSDEIDPSVPKY